MSDPEARRSIDIRVLKYAAPALLTILACTQLTLGLKFGLTPWKGGGFGMFSTVDSPGARSVRVYLVTPDGELPTRAPSYLRNRRHDTRSFPADFRIRSLADKLAAATWVYREDESSTEEEGASDPDDAAKPGAPSPESMSGAAGVDIPPERVRPRPEDVVAKSARATSPAPAADDSESERIYPRLTGLRSEEEIDDREVVDVDAVRVEVWRLVFDAETHELRGERIKQATAKVPER